MCLGASCSTLSDEELEELRIKKEAEQQDKQNQKQALRDGKRDEKEVEKELAKLFDAVFDSGADKPETFMQLIRDNVFWPRELVHYLNTRGNTEEEIIQLFDLIEDKRKEDVNFERLATLLANYERTEEVELTAKALMKAVDIDGSGEISVSELSDFLVPRGCKKEDVRVLFDTIDTDGSGNITKEELFRGFVAIQVKLSTRRSPLAELEVPMNAGRC